MHDRIETRLHPFDAATAVSWSGGRASGRTSDAYWAFVGPYGGFTAAVILRAILEHPDRAGDPLALTVNYCAPIAKGLFDLDVRRVRANRSSQHWIVELSQGGEVCATATAITAERRQTWSHTPASPPGAPPPETLTPATSTAAEWPKQYDFRFVEGAPRLNGSGPGSPASARTVVWMADVETRPLDHVSIAALADAFFARIFHVLGEVTPFGTVSMTTQFHADAADLAAEGATRVLGVADAHGFHKSYFDQTGVLWSPSGRLIATTSQTAYFKA